MTGARTIKVVAALIRDEDGRVLLVRKRGTTPSCSRAASSIAGEDDITALSREVSEELGCLVVPASVRPLGEFDAVAANEPGFRVRANLYARRRDRRDRAEPGDR